MFDMLMSSISLFFQGKLFQEPSKAMTQLLFGIIAGTVAGVIVGQFAPLWTAGAAAGAVSGLLQPYLFKNLKYA